MSAPREYEFTEEQNHLIGDVASKMRFVGLFSNLFGVFALLITLILVLYMNMDRLPSNVRNKINDTYQKGLTEDQKKAAEEAMAMIPKGNNFLMGVTIFTGVTGLFFLLLGSWSRDAGKSFQLIVDTKGSDIKNLMTAMGSLQWMYGMISKLLTVALLAGVIALGWSLYSYFTAG